MNIFLSYNWRYYHTCPRKTWYK